MQIIILILVMEEKSEDYQSNGVCDVGTKSVGPLIHPVILIGWINRLTLVSFKPYSNSF